MLKEEETEVRFEVLEVLVVFLFF